MHPNLEGQTLLLVDGSSYLYRAYHAMPDLRSPSGDPTGALYGIITMLRKTRKDHPAQYSACVFDAKGKTFRDDIYADYKAHRPRMPADLVQQIAPIHDLVKALGWPLLMVDHVEADDVIGTLARHAHCVGMHVIISTGDKDLAQLVNERTTLINTMTQERLDYAGVCAKFGVPPERIIDFLSLTGDTVDNIPGVAQCGPKTAMKWLKQYGSLDTIIEQASQIKGVVGTNLQRALDFLPIARQLVTIHTDCDLSAHVASIAVTLPTRAEDNPTLHALFTQYGFKHLVSSAQSASRAYVRCAACYGDHATSSYAL